MSDKLFKEFDEVSSKAWKQKIQFDLKGVDYNEALVWNSNEGIDVKPFYHADQFQHFLAVPKRQNSEWKVCQTIFVADTQKSNKNALDIIARGAEAIKFILPSEEIAIPQLLQHIDVKRVSIFVECQFLSTTFVKSFIKTYQSLSTFDSLKMLHIELDIIGHLARTGNWYHNLKSDHEAFDQLIDLYNGVSIDLSLYQNAGSTIVQQLAYAIAHANEYLNHLKHRLSETQKNSFRLTFQVAVGSNYFFEIAKLRALRVLWNTLASEYGFNSQCQIFAKPSNRNKTIYDFNTNMLRSTTECMSAALGGADVINNLAYDAVYHKDNEFGNRIARNQLLILKEESYFDAVENPADGSYYIESLTEELAKKALTLFKDIERNGGFLKQLKQGTIQKKVKECAQREQDQFDKQQIILLGSNKYPNPDDRMADNLELYPFVKQNPVKTLIEPIIEKRLSETLEKNRLKNENN